MTAVNPQGTVYFCQTPLESDYKHQLTFANQTAQSTYFASTVVHTFTDNTYIRKDGGIKVNCNVETLRQCNYLYYQNTGFSPRTYYCFITSMEYLSEDSTLVRFETDCFQTWYFSLLYKPCFVEREHVNDDTVGAHTVPEGLETGEYDILDLRNSPIFETTTPSTDWFVCFAVTDLPNDAGSGQSITKINGEGDTIGGVFNSLHLFATRITTARNVITVFNESGDTLAQAIKNIYVVPRNLVNIDISTGNLATGGSPTTFASTSVSSGVAVYPLYDSLTTDSFQLQQPVVLSGNYTPKNNKLLTYPYTYFYVTNKAGTDVVYHWEDFPFETINNVTRRTATYKKAIVPSASLSAKLYFTNYKNHAESTGYGTRLYNYGINYAKTPICAWTTDYYTNWLTQNGVNMNTSVITSAVSGTISGGLYGGVAGAVVGGVTSGLMAVIGNLAKVHEASVIPDQAQGDLNTGDVMFAYTRNAISFYEMSVKPEYARIIDDFFTMYGYKVNRVKTPSITGRQYWNYVKTIDCNIEGDIPQDDLQVIRTMFDRGCTFWHGATNMYNYNLNNAIV